MNTGFDAAFDAGLDEELDAGLDAGSDEDVMDAPQNLMAGWLKASQISTNEMTVPGTH